MNYLALKLPGGETVSESDTGLTEFAGKAPAEIINAFVPYVIVIAGLILLGLLVMGGFQLMTSAGDPKKTEAGRNKIISGIVGFLIIFLAYWIVQALSHMLGFNLLSR